MSVTPAVTRRILRELGELRTNPPEGIRIVANDENMLDVTGLIEGPEGTPYQGGYFRVKFKFTEEFPAAPPKCWFATKIFHPNVSSSGEICVNTLKKDWKSTYGIGHILVTVKCLLIYPNPESALNEEAGKALLENYEDYCAHAKLITSVHATPKIRPAEFDTPSSTSTTTATPEAEPAAASSSKVATPKNAAAASPTGHKSSTPENTVPLQASTPNTFGVEKPVAKERLTSPSPLGTADSNLNVAAIAAAPTTAVKRAAAAGGVLGGEKRKKALKRL